MYLNGLWFRWQCRRNVTALEPFSQNIMGLCSYQLGGVVKCTSLWSGPWKTMIAWLRWLRWEKWTPNKTSCGTTIFFWGGAPLFWGHNLKSEQNFKSYWLRADELEIWFKRECWGHWTKFIWMTYFKAIWNDVAQQQEWTDHKPVGRSCFKSLCRNWVTLVLTWSTVSYWSCDHVSTPSDWSDSRRSWVLVNSSSECPCAASAFSTSL